MFDNLTARLTNIYPANTTGGAEEPQSMLVQANQSKQGVLALLQ